MVESIGFRELTKRILVITTGDDSSSTHRNVLRLCIMRSLAFPDLCARKRDSVKEVNQIPYVRDYNSRSIYTTTALIFTSSIFLYHPGLERIRRCANCY